MLNSTVPNSSRSTRTESTQVMMHLSKTGFVFRFAVKRILDLLYKMDQSKAALPTMITDAKINKHKAVRNITHIQIHTNINSVIRKK